MRISLFKLLFCTGIWIPGVCTAQVQVSGVVRAKTDNRPLQGVTVQTTGQQAMTTVTNTEGLYQLSGSGAADSLRFSHVGFEPVVVAIAGRSKIDVQLTSVNASLNEVVVIGYGSVRKLDLTGSVGTVNVEDMKKAPVPSFAQALAGRVAGVQVNSTDGQPGGGMNIMIRGAGSLTQSTTPLYVVDGFPIEDLDPNTLNMDDIASVSILKDASSTSIYGSRGANGVVLIQTRRGKQGKPEVTLGGTMGYQLKPPLIPVMSPYEFVKYQMELNPNSFNTPAYTALGKTLDDYKNVQGINWQNEVLNTGAYQNYNLGIRGGSEQTKYAVSGSVFNQKGVIVNTGMDRYTGRLSLDQTISAKFKAGANMAVTQTDVYGQQIRSIYGGGNATSSALIRAWMYRPVSAIEGEDLLNEDADQQAVNTSDFRINPVTDLQNQYQHTIRNQLQSDAFISFAITPDLILKAAAGFMQSNVRNEQFYNSKTSQGSPLNPSNKNGVWGSMSYNNSNSFFNENTLNYKTTIGKDHFINGMLLFGVNQYKTMYSSFTGTQLPNEVKRMDGLDESSGGSFTAPVIYNTRNTMISYAARIDYNFRSKYLLTVNFRADGSSKFLQPWGYFPGGAIAWNMSREKFFSQAFPFITNAKLRASYGQNGNNRVGDFDAYAKLSLNNTGQGYSFNNQAPIPAAYLSTLGNPLLRWEKTEQMDIGYEIGLLDNRVGLEVDWYRRTASNLLVSTDLPQSSGFGSAQVNIGSLRNTGWEFTLNTTNIKTTDFNWTSSFNISFNKNKILSLAYGQSALSRVPVYLSQFGQPLYLSELGKPVGMMIGYIWDGNYQYQDFNNPAPGVYILKPDVAANGTARNAVQPGDIKLRDLNGDGTVNAADMTIIGRGQPVHIGGFNNNFNYKGFSLNVFFQWSQGNNIYNANRLLLEGNSNGFANINQYATYANRWSPENPTDENYRTRGQGFIGYFSSKNIEDGSYLRLKTLSLSYAVPSRLIRKAWLRNLSVDLSAQNLFTWTQYSGLDPEVSVADNVLMPGYDFSAYPNVRTIVFGLKATF
ncbi:SusC/RagA family TonB-linked outer membrane protein [Niabella hirudinis]|uniref:SusC/RagA family TonB-linked outer membrane protein n=1 Tax=Niabella hirudinis TaxID=1285929 RepID=UPI003EB88A80